MRSVLLATGFRQEGVDQRLELVDQFVLAGQHVDAGGHRREDRHKVGGHTAVVVTIWGMAAAATVLQFRHHRLESSRMRRTLSIRRPY